MEECERQEIESHDGKNIYKKVQWVKVKLSDTKLKKSGRNTYSKYDYFELKDFLPTLIKLCDEVGLFTKISFTNELAVLTIINADNPSEQEIYTSPMKEISLSSCNDIQALGGVETYSRRYLYMSAFDIVENDMFDKGGKVVTGVIMADPQNGEDAEPIVRKITKPQEHNERKASPEQIKILTDVYKENLPKLLEVNKLQKIEDMSMVKASELISKLKEKNKEVKNERTN